MSELNEQMEFGLVVASHGNGTVVRDQTEYANEVVYLNLDADGQLLNDDLIDVLPGWSALSGFTGQYSYNGPVMHASEYIGGGLERHIRENAGFYVAVLVDGIPEDENGENPSIGWAILFRPFEQES